MKKSYIFLLLLGVIFSSCAKKGQVDIKDIGFWANNCTPPYEIQFYLDVFYQPKEVTYTWDFGDGTTSFEKEPAHIYNNSGTYTVKLTVVNYKTTVEKTLIVDVSQNPMPIYADFDFETLGDKLYAPCEFTFYNKSQYATNFFWNFGDGLGSTDIDPTHIYQDSGRYQITLNAICNGDTASSVMQVDVLPPPSKIYVDVVNVWMPQDFLGGLFELEYSARGLNETPINLPDIQANSFPITWIIGQSLFFFDGDYNSEQLYFQVNDKVNYDQTVYSFSTRFEDIQDDYYPDTLFWSAGNGFSAQVVLSYGD